MPLIAAKKLYNIVWDILTTTTQWPSILLTSSTSLLFDIGLQDYSFALFQCKR